MYYCYVNEQNQQADALLEYDKHVLKSDKLNDILLGKLIILSLALKDH